MKSRGKSNLSPQQLVKCTHNNKHKQVADKENVLAVSKRLVSKNKKAYKALAK